MRLVDQSKKTKWVVGTLHLTTTHLIFIDPHGAKETWVCVVSLFIIFLFRNITFHHLVIEIGELIH